MINTIPDADYWKNRFAQLEEARHQKSLAKFEEIKKAFEDTEKEIDFEISKWYAKLAYNNDVSMAEAEKLLKNNERKEFLWDVREYIKHGEENGISADWNRELINASAKFHITRLDKLKLETRKHIEDLYFKYGNEVSDIVEDTYVNDYLRTAYEMQNGFGFAFEVGKPDENMVRNIISKPWAPDKYNFSTRIWNNKNKLISTVHNELTQGLMRGLEPRKVINRIAKKMETSKFNAGRLVMTETAYFSSLALGDCLRDLDAPQYEIVATLDDRTSEICQSMDGKTLPMKVYQPGVTAPPFHVYCRSTTVPYFGNDYGSFGERAARDGDGKTYFVRGDMTYPEWKQRFVKQPEENKNNPKLVSAANKAGTKAEPAEIKGVSTGHNVGKSGTVYKDEKIDFSSRKNVDNSGGSGIIKENDRMAVEDVHYIGKINTEIYKCVTPDITTNEVVITERQVEHIKERHPNDYERYFQYAKEIIENPDYILEANKPDTAFILKHIVDNDKNYQMILRLKTSSDPKEYKNSIITFLKLSDKKVKKYLRNKKILYKSE